MDALIRFTGKCGFYNHKDIEDYFKIKLPKQDNYFLINSSIKQIKRDDILYFSYKSKVVAIGQFTGNSSSYNKKGFMYGYQIKNIKLLDNPIYLNNKLFAGRAVIYIKNDAQKEELKKIPYSIDKVESLIIKLLKVENFTLFKNEVFNFSKGINIFIGENGTGKSQILKLLYSIIKANNKDNRFNESIISEFKEIFRPTDKEVKNLISFGEKKSSIKIDLSSYNINFNFTENSRYEVNIEESSSKFYKKETIFIPTKEILSNFKGFIATYSKREIAFDKTTNDLALELDLPLLKEQSLIAEKNRELEEILQGEIIQLNGEFYLRRFEDKKLVVSSMMAEGLRKIGTISYLLKNGALNKDCILFWDEPESNLNPKLIKDMVDLLIFLESLDIQIFIATHNYFMIKYFDIRKKEKKNMELNFISFFKEGNQIKSEIATDIYDLEHNAIIDEMENIYLANSKLFYKGNE